MKALLPATMLLALAARPALAADVDIQIDAPASDKVAWVYSDFYGYPVGEVREVVAARPDDAAVILHVAQAAHVRPRLVLDACTPGRPLFDVAQRFHVAPSVFFVDVPRGDIDRCGPPYGRAWGYWRKYGDRWPNGVRLGDRDLVLVNNVHLRSRYFGHDPLDVCRGVRDPVGCRDGIVRDLDDHWRRDPYWHRHGDRDDRAAGRDRDDRQGENGDRDRDEHGRDKDDHGHGHDKDDHGHGHEKDDHAHGKGHGHGG